MEKTKEYANENNVDIIGDIPIYMGLDSSDVWADAGEFLLDENLTPVKVAGVPPDAFSDLDRNGEILFTTGIRWKLTDSGGGEPEWHILLNYMML